MLPQGGGDVLVGETVPAELVQQEDAPLVWQVRRRQIHKGVGVPAPVDALPSAVGESKTLFGGDAPHIQIAEHLSACAVGLPQIFMLVGGGVLLLQLRRVHEEAAAQPGFRHIQIAAAGTEPPCFRAGKIPIDPVGCAPRRVEGLEHQRKLAAAQNALLDGANLLLPAELVILLEPQQPEVPERRFQGLDFFGVVHAEEQNFLSRGLVQKLQRRQSAFELPRQAHFADGPKQLGIDRTAQAVFPLAEDHRMAFGVAQQLQQQLQRDIGAFAGAAASRQQNFPAGAAFDGGVHLPKGGRNAFTEAECRQ